MKVVHIESGLGNQMLSYAEYLVLKKLNPYDECFIETIIFEIPDCEKTVCQWNGYELDRIFGIKAPNIKDILTIEQWAQVINSVRQSEFWEKNWNYPQVIVETLKSVGLSLKNNRGDVEFISKESFKSRLTNNYIGYSIKRLLRPLYKDKYISKMSTRNKIFIKTNESLFTGQFLGLCHVDSGIEFVKKEIRRAFKFPTIIEPKNLDLLNIIHSENSVAIHARRGDMLKSNGYCYRYGYFKRSVKFIKKHVNKPIFIFFCDPGSVEWCKQNLSIFGLDFKRDTVLFADWNKGNESYRDMQLMAECKHNVITNSSFGWWGAYLNKNPDKITCSPCVWLNTTNTF